MGTFWGSSSRHIFGHNRSSHLKAQSTLDANTQIPLMLLASSLKLLFTTVGSVCACCASRPVWIWVTTWSLTRTFVGHVAAGVAAGPVRRGEERQREARVAQPVLRVAAPVPCRVRHDGDALPYVVSVCNNNKGANQRRGRAAIMCFPSRDQLVSVGSSSVCVFWGSPAGNGSSTMMTTSKATIMTSLTLYTTAP